MKLFITLVFFAGVAQGQINNNPSYLTKAIAASTYVPYTGATKVINTGPYGVTASSFTGSGAALTAITAANISGGSLGSNVIASSVAVGSVYNDATTATSANTASAIVARDPSGNFTVGTITGSLVGTASLNVLKAGDTMTGDLIVPGLNVTTVTFPAGGAFNYQRNVLNNNLTVTSSVTFSANAFSVGGSTFVVNQGRAMIGTSSPDTNAALSVAGNISNTGVITSSGTGNNYFAGNMSINLSTPIFTLTDTRDGSDWVLGGTLGEIAFKTSDTSGIGPHINSAIKSLTDGSSTPGGSLGFFTSVYNQQISEKMHIDGQTGNVGIGTTSPASKLDISSGTITMAGTGAPSTGGALCLNSKQAISKCTSALDASGNCTCP